MASQRLKRTMRGALVVAAVVAAASFVPALATADPAKPPSPLQQYEQLSQQASTLNNQLQAAQVDLQNKQQELQAATNDLAAAQQAQTQAEAQEEQFREQVDKLTAASFEGARFNSLSALLTGKSAQDFLNRATALEDLAYTNDLALHGYTSAVDRAHAAQARAQKDQQQSQAATTAAAALVTQITQQAQALNAQLAQVKKALGNLTSADLKVLNDTGIQGVFLAPPGVAGQAMQKALSMRGVPYVWGGATPKGFDCSGLVMWAYAQEGISLPHSSQAQSRLGVAVSRANLQPGDLVFFGNPVHHVGIYVGNGDMVDAPDTGEVVKVQPLDRDYSGARRISG